MQPQILDFTLAKIQAFNQAMGGGVAIRKVGRGYSLFTEDSDEPVARIRPASQSGWFEILYWSGERWKLWTSRGTRHSLDDALEQIASDPDHCFWE